MATDTKISDPSIQRLTADDLNGTELIPLAVNGESGVITTGEFAKWINASARAISSITGLQVLLNSKLAASPVFTAISGGTPDALDSLVTTTITTTPYVLICIINGAPRIYQILTNTQATALGFSTITDSDWVVQTLDYNASTNPKKLYRLL